MFSDAKRYPAIRIQLALIPLATKPLFGFKQRALHARVPIDEKLRVMRNSRLRSFVGERKDTRYCYTTDIVAIYIHIYI